MGEWAPRPGCELLFWLSWFVACISSLAAGWPTVWHRYSFTSFTSTSDTTAASWDEVLTSLCGLAADFLLCCHNNQHEQKSQKIQEMILVLVFVHYVHWDWDVTWTESAAFTKCHSESDKYRRIKTTKTFLNDWTETKVTSYNNQFNLSEFLETRFLKWFPVSLQN